MKLLERILLATDFSRSSHDAQKMALYVAKVFESEIHLLHVIPTIQETPFALDAIRQAVKKEVDGLCDSIHKEGVKVAESVIVEGAPFEQIIHESVVRDVNIVMLGSSEDSESRDSEPGTTAEKVIWKSTKPIWLVKRGSEPPIKKVVCTLDFSEHSGHALQNAIHLCRKFNAELILITVIQPLSSLYPAMMRFASQQQEEYQQRVSRQFDDFIDEYDFRNVTWTKVLRDGKPHIEIVKFIEETRADLLVMGTVGRGALARMLMGSVAERVLRQLPCSMLTMKSEHAIRLRLEEEISDIETHMKQGRELLENGFTEEALSQFEHCIALDMMYGPAWEGMAVAHERLGHTEEAEKYRERAKYIRQHIWESHVQSDVGKQGWRKKL